MNCLLKKIISLPARSQVSVNKMKLVVELDSKTQHIYLEKELNVLHIKQRGGSKCRRANVTGWSHLGLQVMFIIGSEDKLKVGL